MHASGQGCPRSQLSDRSVLLIEVVESGYAPAHVSEAQPDGAQRELVGVELPRRPQHSLPLEERPPPLPLAELYLVLVRARASFLVEVPDEVPRGRAHAAPAPEVRSEE